MVKQGKTISKIVNFLEKQPNSRPKSIAEALGISRQYVQRLLANNAELFFVTGAGPNRFYRNTTPNESKVLAENSSKNIEKSIGANLVDKHFYSLTPLGEELIGKKGFSKWCRQRKFDEAKKQAEYISIIQKYYPNNFKIPIDFTNKVKNTFTDLALNKVWAVDYYNIEIFGKTKLGTQVMIAKQTGNDQAIMVLVDKISLIADNIIKKYNIGAVAFVSPTIQRQSQLMSGLEANVVKDIPRLKVHKVGAKILIPQKTLKSLDDRILNAAQTFVVESSYSYKNVLIIDDALGSGATLNEIAKQIKYKKIAQKCYGLVLVSSPSGYEVINEV